MNMLFFPTVSWKSAYAARDIRIGHITCRVSVNVVTSSQSKRKTISSKRPIRSLISHDDTFAFQLNNVAFTPSLMRNTVTFRSVTHTPRACHCTFWNDVARINKGFFWLVLGWFGCFAFCWWIELLRSYLWCFYRFISAFSMPTSRV